MNETFEKLIDESGTSNQILPLSLNGFLVNNKQDPTNRPNGTPFNQWIQCIEGSGELILNSRKMLIKEGQGIFLIANTPHSYYGITDPWITQNFSFSGSICDQTLKTIGLKESGAYQVTDLNITHKFIQNILMYQKMKLPLFDRQCSKELYTFLIDLSFDLKIIRISETAMENKILGVIDQYLIDHYYEPISLDVLASLVDIRKEYLCTLFKQHMHETISHHLQKIRIAHAKFYLINNLEKTVKEIGVLCGFESTSYFCRIFKKLTNCTPDEYRRSH